MDLITTGGSGGSSEYSLAAIDGASVFCSDDNRSVAGWTFAYSNSDSFIVSDKNSNYLTCNKSGTYKITLDISAKYSSASILLNDDTILTVDGSRISFMNRSASGEITQPLNAGDIVKLNKLVTTSAASNTFYSVLACVNIYKV